MTLQFSAICSMSKYFGEFLIPLFYNCTVMHLTVVLLNILTKLKLWKMFCEWFESPTGFIRSRCSVHTPLDNSSIAGNKTRSFS